jgi:hypothetical protein
VPSRSRPRVTSCLAGVQGYVGYNSDNATTILAFRGSSNVQNWIVDFSFPLVQFDGLPAGAKVVEPCVYTRPLHLPIVRCTGALTKRFLVSKCSREPLLPTFSRYFFTSIIVVLRFCIVVLRAVLFILYSSRTSVVSRFHKDLCVHCTKVIATGHSLGAALAGLFALDTGRGLGGALTHNQVNFRACSPLFSSSFGLQRARTGAIDNHGLHHLRHAAHGQSSMGAGVQSLCRIEFQVCHSASCLKRTLRSDVSFMASEWFITKTSCRIFRPSHRRDFGT